MLREYCAYKVEWHLQKLAFRVIFLQYLRIFINVYLVLFLFNIVIYVFLLLCVCILIV
jgi:hypothetical protein